MSSKTAQRIYTVAIGEATRLVRAAHPAQAMRYVAQDTMVVAVASQDDLVKHIAAGVTVEPLPAVAAAQLNIEGV